MRIVPVFEKMPRCVCRTWRALTEIPQRKFTNIHTEFWAWSTSIFFRSCTMSNMLSAVLHFIFIVGAFISNALTNVLLFYPRPNKINGHKVLVDEVKVVTVMMALSISSGSFLLGARSFMIIRQIFPTYAVYACISFDTVSLCLPPIAWRSGLACVSFQP